jgi:hypothetical protein
MRRVANGYDWVEILRERMDAKRWRLLARNPDASA